MSDEQLGGTTNEDCVDLLADTKLTACRHLNPLHFAAYRFWRLTWHSYGARGANFSGAINMALLAEGLPGQYLARLRTRDFALIEH